MRILVTGGDGMLAKAIRKTNEFYNLNLVFAGKIDLDITNWNKVSAYFSDSQFDLIINCAAYTNVEKAESDIENAFAVNETGSLNLAKAANAMGAYLIHISTDAVYDGKKSNVYFETDICNPLSVYSSSKYAGEKKILNHHDSGIIIRTSWLWSLDKANFVTAIMNKARATGQLNVVADQLGTPTYTYDLADAIFKIVMSGKMIKQSGIEIYHYSNEGAISWYDFAVNICRVSGIKVDISPVATSEYPSKVIRPFHALLSKEKIKRQFGLQIPYWRDSLESGLLGKIHVI